MLIIDRSVITDGGAALLNSGDPINITSVKTGSGTYTSSEDIKSRTALKSTQYSYTPSSVTVDGATRSIDALLSNYDPDTETAIVTSDYTLTEVGLFATVNGADVLFAIGVSYDGSEVPAFTGQNKSEIIVNWDMAVSGTDAITITATGAPALATDLNTHVNSEAYSASGVHGLRVVLDDTDLVLQAYVNGDWEDVSGGGPKTATITLSADTVTVDDNTSTATVTFTTNSDGTPSVSSSDDNIATASVSGTTVTITGVDTGSATVTVSIPATAAYTAVSATISVTSSMAPIPELVIGNTYYFGGFYWTAAEDLGDNTVCLQSQGMTGGTWPGYKLTTDYTGTKNYGSANTAYNGNIDGDNIANYDAVTQTWYTKYSAVEKTGQAYGSGLFLVSNAKCNQTTSGQQGSGNYWSGLKTAAVNHSSVGAENSLAWIGTTTSGNTWIVNSDGSVGTNGGFQGNKNVLAPAFNLDVTKVKLVGTATLALRSEVVPTIVTWANGTDAQIKAMLDAYYNDVLSWSDMGWNVGDTRLMHFDAMQAPDPNGSNTWAAQDITVVIVDHDHTDLTTPINGHTKTCITVQTREVMNDCASAYNDAGHIYINGDASNDMTFTPWKNLYMNTYLNTVVLGAIPAGDFKSAIKATNHYRHTTYNTAADELVSNTLFLPSYPEIFGTASYSYYTPTTHTEGTQLAYYQTSANLVKNGNNAGESNGVAQNYWEGSPGTHYASGYGYTWGAVTNTGVAAYNWGNTACALAPAWGM